MKKKLLFIINPNSGHGRGKKVIDLIPNFLDLNQYEYECKLTHHPAHATEIAAEAVVDHAFAVIAVGGDGIVNETFQALVNTDVAFGIIPRGSGNGVARSLGIPLKVEQALTQLNTAQINVMDTVTFNGKPYLGVAGIGFDGLIAWKFAKGKTRGFWSYIKLIFKEVTAFNSSRYTLEINGEKIDYDAFVVAIANTPQYGNDAFIAPESKFDDGLLDVVVAKKHSKWLAPLMGYKVMTKQLLKSKHIETIKCTQLTLYSEYAYGHVDGEPIEVKNENSIKISPLSLKIIV